MFVSRPEAQQCQVSTVLEITGQAQISRQSVRFSYDIPEKIHRGNFVNILVLNRKSCSTLLPCILSERLKSRQPGRLGLARNLFNNNIVVLTSFANKYIEQILLE